MFRAVYNSASAFTTASDTDGKATIRSDVFKIRRGVVQGDITSPLYFILALPKTKAMHVRAQDPISATTNGEAAKMRKFVCPHAGCAFRFRTKRGMLVHKG